MPDDVRTLLALVFVFVPLSLFSIGGGTALLAEIEHQSVTVHGWTTQREFADLFAISRAAPGPGTMLSALIGWKAAGLAGAVTATVALYLPSSLLVYGAVRLCGRWRGSVWYTAIERGLAPIAAGLILAGGVAVLRASPGGAAVWLAAIASTAVILAWPRLHPLLLFAAGGALFALADTFGLW
jgi:chromate transporter